MYFVNVLKYNLHIMNPTQTALPGTHTNASDIATFDLRV